MRVRGETGILQLPLAIALVATAAGSAGAWSFLRQWRGLAELQLRLDRCVAGTALALRRDLDRIEASNRRLKAARAAGALLTAAPPARAAARAEAEAEALYQRGLEAAWDARRGAWLARRGCDGTDLPWPLPSMRWRRAPPDSLGPQPLFWDPAAPRALRVQLGHPPRHAAAEVRHTGGNGDVRTRWKARWAPPLPRIGTGAP
jgi:hypothetical protein